MSKARFVWVLLTFLLVFSSATRADQTAKQVVEEFQTQLISVMKQGKTLGFKGRYEKMEPLVKKSHDLPKIARIVIGKQWEELTADQQARLEDVFTRLSVSAYAHNFKDYSGESFVFVSEEETGRGGVIVHTNLLIPGEKDVKFDYQMKKKDGDGWLIMNIIADGVSDLALKRSEYTSVLMKDGFDALVSKMNEKTKSYAAQNN